MLPTKLGGREFRHIKEEGADVAAWYVSIISLASKVAIPKYSWSFTTGIPEEAVEIRGSIGNEQPDLDSAGGRTAAEFK